MYLFIFYVQVEEMKRHYENKLHEVNERAKTAQQRHRWAIVLLPRASLPIPEYNSIFL